MTSLRSVREELVGATGGAELHHLDPPLPPPQRWGGKRGDAQLGQLTPIGLSKVKVQGAVPLRVKELLPVVEICLHQLNHFGPDLITTGADTGAEASYDVSGATAVGFRHGRDRLHSNPRDGAPPAGVGQANGSPDGIVEQNGQAIGKAEHEGHAGSIGDQNVGDREHSAAILRPHQGHLTSVDLLGDGDVSSRDAQGLADEAVVGLYRFTVITDEEAHVERIIRRMAHPTQPREYTMKNLIV